jgi:hypothetical protein
MTTPRERAAPHTAYYDATPDMSGPAVSVLHAPADRFTDLAARTGCAFVIVDRSVPRARLVTMLRQLADGLESGYYPAPDAASVEAWITEYSTPAPRSPLRLEP